MSKPGPDRIEARKLAADGAFLTRDYPLVRFARLSDSILRQDGVVHVDARFCEVQGRPAVDLDVTGMLVVRCQRCLGLLDVPVASHVGLVFDMRDASEELPAGEYEAVPLDAGAVDLAALVEDELLLSVPLVALHEDCSVATAPGGAEPGTAQPEGTQRPFAGLKDLLKH